MVQVPGAQNITRSVSPEYRDLVTVLLQTGQDVNCSNWSSGQLGLGAGIGLSVMDVFGDQDLYFVSKPVWIE